MTADEAKQLTAQATALDGEKVRIVLDCWHRAIEKAAKAGETSVRESQVDRVRTPIPPAARMAALERLQADGFQIDWACSLTPREQNIKVSWA